mmetsp:Transcript_21577/g.27989  ORF Transcript_21577/g.27989 Transcript_21577/m.27989 type:complete len:102 (-) Transcript_21577:916-1221(-)
MIGNQYHKNIIFIHKKAFKDKKSNIWNISIMESSPSAIKKSKQRRQDYPNHCDFLELITSLPFPKSFAKTTEQKNGVVLLLVLERVWISEDVARGVDIVID